MNISLDALSWLSTQTTLAPPSVPGSGLAFAESAPKIYKAMEDSEWHRVSAE